VELKPVLFGHTSVESLLEAIPHVVQFHGKPPRRYVQLAPDLDGNIFLLRKHSSSVDL
jgi:hypothetical protein